jgi:hypothetical protein
MRMMTTRVAAVQLVLAQSRNHMSTNSRLGLRTHSSDSRLGTKYFNPLSLRDEPKSLRSFCIILVPVARAVYNAIHF